MQQKCRLPQGEVDLLFFSEFVQQTPEVQVVGQNVVSFESFRIFGNCTIFWELKLLNLRETDFSAFREFSSSSFFSLAATFSAPYLASSSEKVIYAERKGRGLRNRSQVIRRSLVFIPTFSSLVFKFVFSLYFIVFSVSFSAFVSGIVFKFIFNTFFSFAFSLAVSCVQGKGAAKPFWALLARLNF